MEAKIRKIADFDRISYSTIQLEGQQTSEFMDFQYRMAINISDRREKDKLTYLLMEAGNKYGATDFFFRNEPCSTCWPFLASVESNTSSKGLKLYCVRVSPEVVILLNGDRKTSKNSLACNRCLPHFELATKATDAIREQIWANWQGSAEEVLTKDGFILHI